MDGLISFFTTYGLALFLIALSGIFLLGVLKYSNVFGKISEHKRHYLYLIITVGLSVVAAAIYLAVIGDLNTPYFLAVATAIYALNQTFYNIFKVTPVNKLLRKAADYLISYLSKENK